MRQESLQGCLAVQGKVAQSRGRVVPPAAVQDQRQYEVVACRAVGGRQAVCGGHRGDAIGVGDAFGVVLEASA